MRAGVSMKDPSIAPFVARAYSLVKRTLMDRAVVAGLDELESEVTEKQLWDSVKGRMNPLIQKLHETAVARNAQLAEQARAKKAEEA
jgi:hypothetical protein